MYQTTGQCKLPETKKGFVCDKIFINFQPIYESIFQSYYNM